MSSFKKAFKLSRPPADSSSKPAPTGASSPGPSPSGGRGLKAWINGQRLASTGHRQLDELLGGGCVLGTTLLLELDQFSNYGATLLAYSAAEALSNDQALLLVTATARAADDFVSAMPYNLTLADELASAVEVVPPTGEDADALRIAWQYEKYTQQVKELKARSSKDSFCCSYDLSRRGQASLSSSARIHRLVLEDLTEDSDAGARYARCFAEISSRIVRLKEASPGLTVRVFVPHLFSAHVYADLDSASVCRCVARTLLCLRQVVRRTDSLLVLSYLPDALPPRLAHLLASFADSRLRVESFAGAADAVPYEFKEFCGLLALQRVQAVGVLAPFRPQAHRFGLRRDRRKLHVEALHLPPEESRAFGSSDKKEGASALEPGAACGPAVGSVDKSRLDF